MTEKDLLELKEKIKEANEKFLQLKGQREALLQQLKEDWECTTIKQAQTKIDDIEKELTKINSEILEGIKNLENDLNGTD
jgi:DNA-binding FrmR family transcriptional regulator